MTIKCIKGAMAASKMEGKEIGKLLLALQSTYRNRFGRFSHIFEFWVALKLFAI